MRLISILLVFLAAASSAQTKLEKTIPVKVGQHVRFTFDYPELIRVSTWDKNEISIQGTVSINDGESDAAFVLDTHTQGDVLDVQGKIKDMEELPQRITIMRNGIKTVFKNEAEFKKYKKENNLGNFDVLNRGLDMDITLDIKVPANVETSVISVYGMVEVRQFNGPLRVEATYGGVDASISESVTGELTAETNYGHIYSDLNLRSREGIRDEDFHTVVSAKLGNGPAYRLESPYGNVYLRRFK